MTLAEDKKDSFDHGKFEAAAKHLHSKGAFSPDMMNDAPVRGLTAETFRVLSSAIPQDVPVELRTYLQENTFIFSGFKTYHELKEASALLQDDKGGFKSFEVFKRDITGIDNNYNKNYLNAEYKFAVQSSQMAVKWHEFEKDGDSYLLQYRTASDDKVRPEHAVLNGTTLPIDDPFWNSYLPPLDWGCRCTTVQVSRNKYPVSNSQEACAAGERATSLPKQKIFRFNPGKDKVVFPPKHPYFKLAKEDKPTVKEIVEEQSQEARWKAELPDSLTPEQKDAIIQNFKDIEAGLGISKGKPMTYEEADRQSTNPNIGLGREYGINCQTCSPAYMLRLRGFDITAKPNTKGSKLEWLSTHWSKCWKNADGTDVTIISFHSWMEQHGYSAMTPARYMAFFRDTCKEPGIYEIGLSWKGKGGHCTIIEKMADGTLRYIEPQRDNSPGSARAYNDINNLCSRMTQKPYYSRSGIYGKDNEDGIIRIDDKVFDKSLLEIFAK